MGTPVCKCGHSHGSSGSICPIIGCSCNTFTDQRDIDIRNLKEQKDAAELMAKALEDRAKAAETQVAELRETVTRLNRRCQEAERAANVKVEDIRKQGGSFGRALAAWSAGDQRRRADIAEQQLKELIRLVLEEHLLPKNQGHVADDCNICAWLAQHWKPGDTPKEIGAANEKMKCGVWTQWGQCVAEMPCKVHCNHKWSESGGDNCGICGQFKGPEKPNVPGVSA